MFLRCNCPQCGDLKEYVAEQVGITADCFKCGASFELQDNPGRHVWQIVPATVAVLCIVGSILGRAYLRASRWERTAQRHAATSPYKFSSGSSHSDDD